MLSSFTFDVLTVVCKNEGAFQVAARDQLAFPCHTTTDTLYTARRSYYAALLLLAAVVTLHTVPACVGRVDDQIIDRVLVVAWSAHNVADLEDDVFNVLFGGSSLEGEEIELVTYWLRSMRDRCELWGNQ